MFKHILVPTDGSDLSEAAVARAVSFAKESGSKLTFFHAQPTLSPQHHSEGALIILIDPTLPERYAKAAKAEANHILQRAKKMADTRSVEADTDSMVSEFPYKSIIDAANRHGCDLIFMASHGRSGVAGLLLGSETQKVLIHSKIPVLVYR